MNGLMVVVEGKRWEDFNVLRGKDISVGSDPGNTIVLPAGEGVPRAHQLLQYDSRPERWKLRVLPTFDGYLRHRGGGRKVPLARIARAGHLRDDAGSRIFTLYTHQLSGRVTLGGTEIRFYFMLPQSRVARPPRHLDETRASA